MLVGRVHLAKRLLAAGGDEHRIVAEAPLAARRPHQNTLDPALEPFAVAVGPAQSEGADKMGVAARVGAKRLQLFPDAAHRAAEIALAGDLAGIGFGRNPRVDEGPARREDAGSVAQGCDAEAAVVGERRQAGKVGGRARLQIRVVDEGGADLVRLRQFELRRRDRLDAIGTEQVDDLADLAFIVAGDDEPPRLEPSHRPVTLSWAVKISAQPIRASLSSRSNPSSSKHSPSAAICASTSLPSSVSTKLPSQPAALSSA